MFMSAVLKCKVYVYCLKSKGYVKCLRMESLCLLSENVKFMSTVLKCKVYGYCLKMVSLCLLS